MISGNKVQGERHWVVFFFRGGSTVFLALGAFFLLATPGRGEDQSLFFSSSDQVRIHALFRQGGEQPNARLIIVAPGFAQHAGTRSMQALASALTATADVLVVDFRGNGGSGGVFTFGAREYLDLEPVLKWSERYVDVTLMGFSLGAYHSVCAAQAFPGSVRRLLLVSCPTCVEEIVTNGGAFLNPLVLLFRRVVFQYPPEEDLLFRWGWPFSKKAESSAPAAQLRVPCHFLVGCRDTLVFESLTRKVFEAVSAPKTCTRVPQGLHAEAMFLQFPDAFTAWVKAHMQ